MNSHHFPLAALSLALFAGGCMSPPAAIPRAHAGQWSGPAASADAGQRPIDPARSRFVFTGYAPITRHDGTFDEMRGSLLYRNGIVVGASGTIQAASVNTGIRGLDRHLRSAAFFDAARHPVIHMESSQIHNGLLTGRLSFHGVTRELQFPVTVDASGLHADVVIRMRDFGIAYPGVCDEVRIRFDLAGK